MAITRTCLAQEFEEMEREILEREHFEKNAGAAAYQVGGGHYIKLDVQPWEAMEAWMSKEEFQGFLRGNAIKYLARDKGNRLEDWRKAKHYIEKLIEVSAK